MIRFFSGTNPLNILVLFILGALFRLPFFIHADVPVSFPDAGWGYMRLEQSVFFALRQNPWWMYVITYLLLFVQAISLNGFINSQKLFPASNLLFAYLWLLYTSLIPSWNVISPVLLFNLLITVILPKMVRLYQQQKPQNDLFIIGFLGGLTGLLYQPGSVIIAWLLIALLVIRPFRLTECVILLLGFLMPYYFTIAYCYVCEDWKEAFRLQPSFSVAMPALAANAELIIAGALMLTPLVYGLFLALKFLTRMLALQRKIWGLVFYQLLTATIFLFTDKTLFEETLPAILLPALFFMTGFAAYPSNKFFPSLMSWLTIGFLIARNFIA